MLSSVLHQWRWTEDTVPSATSILIDRSFDGQMHLNPEDSDIVTNGDKMVFLSAGESMCGF